MKIKAFLATILSVISFASYAKADGNADAQKILEFMSGLQRDYSNELTGEIVGRDFSSGGQTVDCTNVTLGVSAVSMSGDGQPLNVFATKHTSNLSVIEGVHYYDDKMKILELSPRVLKVSNVSLFEAQSAMAYFPAYANLTVFEVSKDENGKLESFTIKAAHHRSQPWFFQSLTDIDTPDELVKCQARK